MNMEEALAQLPNKHVYFDLGGGCGTLTKLRVDGYVYVLQTV